MDFKQKDNGAAALWSDQEGKELWRIGGPSSVTGITGGNQPGHQYRAPFTVKVPLNTSGSATASALLTWQNVGPTDLIIGHTRVDVTTGQTLTCTISVGVGASALSMDVLLIDSFAAAGVTPGSAGVFDNITDKGAAGKARAKLPVNSFVNVICASSGSVTSLTGNLYFDVTVA
jgi:hypothetical protein